MKQHDPKEMDDTQLYTTDMHFDTLLAIIRMGTSQEELEQHLLKLYKYKNAFCSHIAFLNQK